MSEVVPAEALDPCPLERLVPSFGAQLFHGLAVVREDEHRMQTTLLAQDSHRRAVERHRNRFSRLGLIGMNPRRLSTEINLILTSGEFLDQVICFDRYNL